MLLTKLHIPPVGTHIVRRSELFEKLNTGLNRRLILISAPAGFGKTTLVSDWINRQKIPTAWFSLDKGDNDPVGFLSYVISGIQSVNKNIGLSALTLLKSPNKPSIESITSLLINDLFGINKNLLLVLDDYHLIESSDISQLVAHLLGHIPNNIHLVILTRHDPALPLARLRSQRQMVELRASDLNFSVNDISILFNKKLKIKITIEDAHSLETKTEGWIAGLQLTALSMQGRENIAEFIQDLTGDNRYIMDYLIEEVLKIQSDDIKDFLLKTSILEQISAPLCDAVLNKSDSQLILENLEQKNMFVIPLDAERKWYRYHHLFADLLKQRLQRRDKITIYDLHDKASRWFEQNDMYDLAIDHAMKIKNYKKSIQLLSEIVEGMWENGQHASILKYGDLLPVELIKTNPDFCLYYSWILITAGQIQKAKPFLLSAEHQAKEIVNNKKSSKENIQYYKKLLGKISVAFAYSYSHEEHSEKIFDCCKMAMKNLSEDDPLWFSWAWFSYGIAYFSNGDLPRSVEAFKKAFNYGMKSGNIYLISTIVMRMAEIEQQLGHYTSAYKKCNDLLALMKDKGYAQITKAEWTYAALYFVMGGTQYIWGNVERAYESIKTAYSLCKSGADIILKTTISMVYSVLLLKRGDIESEKIVHEVDRLMKQNDIPPFLTSYYIGWRIFLFLDKRQIDKASNIIAEYGLGLRKKKTHANESAYSSYVRLLLVQNKLKEAELLLSELYDLARKGMRIERLIDLDISYAILYKMKGSQNKAVARLIEAMKYASEENLLISFIFSIEYILDLLEKVFEIHTIQKTKIPKKFIENMKLAVEKRGIFNKASVKTALSARELDTLRLSAEDSTNQDIADKLFISLNTVKTHLKNIYQKLEVDSRKKALHKAKELGLL
jgi:LuxR family transcriptional regulator, maltose regulon positive regulatory protein